MADVAGRPIQGSKTERVRGLLILYSPLKFGSVAFLKSDDKIGVLEGNVKELLAGTSIAEIRPEAITRCRVCE